MVRVIDQKQENYKSSRLLHFQGMSNDNGGLEDDHSSAKTAGKDKPSGDVDLLKERFAKLLLGEDMSGGGKGVSSALALSNAITNHAASIFGEHRRLEPMPIERKAKWRKEIDWLLSVSDHIVEFAPAQQKSKDGVSIEIMTTRQRTDLHMNIPALRKLDTMLIDCLDNFKDQNEFYYASKDENDDSVKRNEEKWWVPTPKVPPNGLSDMSKKWLHFQKDSVNQVLKAAMAINTQVLSEMEIPENYIESLPKNGRATLGDTIYKSITLEHFDGALLLSSMDISSEHKIMDLKNKIEASIIIWKRKMNNKDSKSSWGSAVSLEKRELFEERAETLLLLLKHRFPGIPQSALDVSKIQYNRDIGHAILESYSRILEGLAFTVLSRIEDVLHADSVARNPTVNRKKQSSMSIEKINYMPETPTSTALSDVMGWSTSVTLSDFMGWSVMGQGDNDVKGASVDLVKLDSDTKNVKMPAIISTKRSYLENLGGLRSPTSRH